MDLVLATILVGLLLLLGLIGCVVPVLPGPTEGFNNKIRWLIKQAYGYRDYKYFRLKILDLPNLKPDDTDY